MKQTLKETIIRVAEAMDENDFYWKTGTPCVVLIDGKWEHGIITAGESPDSVMDVDPIWVKLDSGETVLIDDSDNIQPE